MAAVKTQSSLPEEFWLSPEFLSDEKETVEAEEDDFFVSLSRRFASNPKTMPEWATAGSPQSTLSGLGSWSADGSPNGPSQVASPPATPFSAENDTWQLIYAAAGQVARLKMASQCHHNRPKFAQVGAGPGLLGNPVRTTNPNQFVHQPPVPGQQFVRPPRQMGPYSEHQIRTMNMAWPPLSRPVTGAAKRECAGTGVFLPRRYSSPPDPRKKPTLSGCPNVVLPTKVVQALNMNYVSHSHAHPRFGCGFAPDHEALIARRNALLEQQRRSLIIRQEAALNHEIRLPQEWTY